MLKGIKISEEVYRDAKKLRDLLEKEKIIPGAYKVTLSLAISFAISQTLGEIEKRKRLRASAGG